MASEYIIQTENLCKSYLQAGKEPIHALSEVTLQIPEGMIFGMLGPNGAGKTTLVRILATLLRPTQGKASVCGYDVLKQEHEVRRMIGYAGQDSERSAYFRLTVEENLLYFAHALRGVPRKAARERIHVFAESVDFSKQLGQYFSTLSGGQKQLVIVLRALIHQPRLVFLDEPSKSLDPVTADRVRKFLVGYVREHNITVLLTTHNMLEAQEVCDELAFINKGRMQFRGTPLQFRQSVRIQEVVQVIPTGNEDLLPILENIPGVTHFSSSGGYRLYSQDSFNVMAEVVTRLKNAGIRAMVGMEEPSLEDAFSIFVSNAEEQSNAG